MKIALIGPTYPFRGGIAHYTTLLVQHLRERHDVLFVSYLKQYPKWLYPGNTDLDPSLESSTLQVECERILTPLNPLTWWHAFTRIRSYSPELLILQWWTPFWSPMLFFLTRLVHHRTKIRVLFLCHHVIAPEGGIFDWFLARRIFWRSQAFIVMSEEDFALLRRALPWARIKGVSHPPYDVFCRMPLSSREARARLGLEEHEPVALFFGFVRRYKGLRYLIDAMPRTREQIPVRLLVVGEFWEDARPYHEQVQRLGLQNVVMFHSTYVPNNELAVYFSAADVVALPYLEATQSGVAQIALGFEKPVIATSVGGMRETIRDGETGLIVPPADVTALSDAMVRYFRDGLKEKYAQNIHLQEQSASWAPLIDLIEELAAPGEELEFERPAPGTRSPRVL